nr:RxLR effector protein [Phytophthora capsici]
MVTVLLSLLFFWLLQTFISVFAALHPSTSVGSGALVRHFLLATSASELFCVRVLRCIRRKRHWGQLERAASAWSILRLKRPFELIFLLPRERLFFPLERRGRHGSRCASLVLFGRKLCG